MTEIFDEGRVEHGEKVKSQHMHVCSLHTMTARTCMHVWSVHAMRVCVIYVVFFLRVGCLCEHKIVSIYIHILVEMSYKKETQQKREFLLSFISFA